MNILVSSRRKNQRQNTGNDPQCNAIQSQRSHANLLSRTKELNIEYVFSDGYFKEGAMRGLTSHFAGQLNLDPIERP
jgi:hypothetical protein